MAHRRAFARQDRFVPERRSASRARRAVGILPTALVMLLTLSLIVALVNASSDHTRQADAVRARRDLVQIAAVRQQAMAATQRAHVALMRAGFAAGGTEELVGVLEAWKAELEALSDSLPIESLTRSTRTIARNLTEFLRGQTTEVVGLEALTGARTRLMPVERRLGEAAVQSGLDGDDGEIDRMTSVLYTLGYGTDAVVAVESQAPDLSEGIRTYGLIIRAIVASGGLAVLTAGPLTGLTSFSEVERLHDEVSGELDWAFGVGARSSMVSTMMLHALDELASLEVDAAEHVDDPISRFLAAAVDGLDAKLVSAVLQTTFVPRDHDGHASISEYLDEVEEYVRAGSDRANRLAGERLKALGSLVDELERDARQRMVVAAIVLGFALLVLGALALLARAAERRARRGALTDALTGLLNRRGFHEYAERAAGEGDRWLVLIDLDHFKPVNDTYGHEVGDAALVAAARTIATAFDELDGVVGRLGGDEFVVTVPHVSRSRIAEAVDRCQRELDRTHAGRHVVRLGCSAGVARHEAGVPISEVLAEADLAMYRAKRTGRGRVAHFDESTRELLAMVREGDISRVLAVSVQFQRRLTDGELVGMAVSVAVHGRDGRTVDTSLVKLIADYAGVRFPLLGGTLSAIGRSERPRPPKGTRVWFTIPAVDLRGVEAVEHFWAVLESAGWAHVPIGVVVRDAESEPFRELDATVSRLERLGVASAVVATGTRAVPHEVLGPLGPSRLVIDDSTVDAVLSDDPVARAAAEREIEVTVALAHRLGLEVVALGISSSVDAARLSAFEIGVGQAAAPVAWTVVRGEPVFAAITGR